MLLETGSKLVLACMCSDPNDPVPVMAEFTALEEDVDPVIGQNLKIWWKMKPSQRAHRLVKVLTEHPGLRLAV